MGAQGAVGKAQSSRQEDSDLETSGATHGNGSQQWILNISPTASEGCLAEELYSGSHLTM